MKQFLKVLIGYGIASACAFLIDLTIFWALVHFLYMGYLHAATLSFLLGSIFAYQLSTTIAFKQHRLTIRNTEFVSFVAIGGVGLLVNGLVIFIGSNLLGMHYLMAKCAASGFTFAINFVLQRQMLFVRRPAF